MGENSKIAWCDHTFNPWWGCVPISAGCANCYARTFAKRMGHDCFGSSPRRFFGDSHWQDPLKWARLAHAAGRKARVFCASMCDFLEAEPGEGLEEQMPLVAERGRLWDLIEKTSDDLDWLLLTKRAHRLSEIPVEIARQVWLGVTVENQAAAEERIPLLLQTPAAVRFLSCEPLLGEVDLSLWIERIDHCDRCHAENSPQTADHCPKCGRDGTLIATWGSDQAERMRNSERYEPGHESDFDGPPLHWVIVGGESGAKARPMDLAWVDSIVQQCREAGVPCFVKQLGRRPFDSREAGRDSDEPHPGGAAADPDCRIQLCDLDGRDPAEWPEDLQVQQWPERADEGESHAS